VYTGGMCQCDCDFPLDDGSVVTEDERERANVSFETAPRGIYVTTSMTF
jgi:hypothetical protein